MQKYFCDICKVECEPPFVATGKISDKAIINLCQVQVEGDYLITPPQIHIDGDCHATKLEAVEFIDGVYEVCKSCYDGFMYVDDSELRKEFIRKKKELIKNNALQLIKEKERKN